MKYNYGLVAVIIACVYISYVNLHKSKAELAKTENAAVINAFLNKSSGESGTYEESLTENGRISHTFGERSQEPAKILSDNSRIHTMYDGYGNKTEARCFNNHPRITCIVLNSNANGQRKVLVYGQNGDIMDLPEDMLGKVLTASGDEIANSAGIYTARKTSQPEYAQTTANPSLPAKPAQESQTSIQNAPGKQIEAETADGAVTSVSSATKPTQSAENIKPKANENLSVPNRQPVEEK